MTPAAPVFQTVTEGVGVLMVDPSPRLLWNEHRRYHEEDEGQRRSEPADHV